MIRPVGFEAQGKPLTGPASAGRTVRAPGGVTFSFDRGPPFDWGSVV
jgi:hypothetical protein